ncbi:MAG: hypothetical protein COT56_04370, partial [Methylobacterium sp. CG09_land_8_20_14_0_10_71_15]
MRRSPFASGRRHPASYLRRWLFEGQPAPGLPARDAQAIAAARLIHNFAQVGAHDAPRRNRLGRFLLCPQPALPDDLEGQRVTSPVRPLLTAALALWSAAAFAQSPPAGPDKEKPASTGSPATPSPAPAPAAPAAPPPQGTPATVLDTQDYESLLGKGVRGMNGDELGRVIDVVIDKDGRPRAAIIDFGGFLGVGSRKIAVDWRSLRFATEGKVGRVTLMLSRNQVRVSPEYKAGDPIVVLGPASPGGAPEGDPAAAAP